MSTPEDLQRHVRPDCLQSCRLQRRLINAYETCESYKRMFAKIIASDNVLTAIVDMRDELGAGPEEVSEIYTDDPITHAENLVTIMALEQEVAAHGQKALTNAAIIGGDCDQSPDRHNCSSPASEAFVFD